MRILFVASELAPLAQTGGLGDAVAGLAAALSARGHDVGCVLPAWRDLLRHPACPPLRDAEPIAIEGEADLVGRWRTGRLPCGTTLWLLDLPALYDRSALYGADRDEARLFATLSRGAAERAVSLHVDALVAHDWHAATSLALLRTRWDGPVARGIAALQVVHNNAYQGRFAADAMRHTGLPNGLFTPQGVEFYGDLCLLKAGLLFADRIVAVSPRYAEELTTPDFGAGLEGVYAERRERLCGIRNGIDPQRFDPAGDPALSAHFDAADASGRARCRAALLEELGLEAPAAGGLLCAVGRFAFQKGWDVLAAALDGLVAGGASLALLGDGEPALREALAAGAARHPGRVRLASGWNEPLARRLYAGADAVLVPSRFEPCGLVQLMAQRYGCLPVAHRVGGLLDTIVDGDTGLLFSPLSAESLVGAAARARALFHERGPEAVARRLLRVDVSWDAPARDWEGLLAETAERVRAGGAA